ATATESAKSIGVVKVVKGNVKIITADGTTKTLSEKDQVHEHDNIVTDASGATLIEFEGGNRTHIHPNTKLTVQEYENSDTTKRATFNLLKGKIRHQVKEKYGGKTSKFEVITPGVVAGVRGTDFIVTQEDQNGWMTRVETLEGSVHVDERIGEKNADVD